MLKERLIEDLKNSMKEKNVVRKNVIQMVRAAILQIEKDKGIEVDDNKILEIIAKEVKTRNDSLLDFEKGGREDLVKQAKEEISILSEYLPKQLTREELKEKITKIVDKLGIGAGAAKIKGENAKIKLNNATFESNTNSFTINGLTITTLEKTNGAISINTTTDNQAIYDKIKNFIKGYNELIKEMDKLYNADSAKGYEPLTDDEKDEMSDEEVKKWETKIKDAILRRDQTLSSVSSVMKNAMSVSINIGDKSYNLSMFGINTGGYFTAEKNEKSMYHIDGDKDDSSSASSTDKLMAAISSDPDGVAEFFSKLSQNVYDALDKKMKSTTLSSAYKVYNDKQMDKDYKNYEKSIAEWEEKVQYYEDYYYKKFGEMETALGKLQSSQSSLSNLLGM